MKSFNRVFLGAALILTAYAAVSAAEPQAQFRTQTLAINSCEHHRYFLLGPKEGAPVPEKGYGLIVALASGDGGRSGLPFLQRIYAAEVPETYLLAQPIAPHRPRNGAAWTGGPDATAFVEAVIREVGSRLRVDPQRVFLMAWSTAGPAAYNISVQSDLIKGAIIAMSPFEAATLAAPDKAEGKNYFLIHSSGDLVYSFAMAEEARDKLRANGANVELVTYEGGHGWRSSMYPLIQQGINWLENPDAPVSGLSAALATRPAGMAGGVLLPTESRPSDSDPLEAVIGISGSAGTVPYKGPRDPLLRRRPVQAAPEAAPPGPSARAAAAEKPTNPAPAKPRTSLNPPGTKYQLKRR